MKRVARSQCPRNMFLLQYSPHTVHIAEQRSVDVFAERLNERLLPDVSMF
jgi:hypothetical protein